MSTSSVFPLEIYEHILECIMENAPYWYRETLLRSLSCVCTAWRWKCRALQFRDILLGPESILRMYKIRKKLSTDPHLAALVENIELRVLITSLYEPIIESFPSILGRFLPRLRRVTITSLVSVREFSIHRHFSIRRVLLHTVTVLEVSHLLFDKNFTFKWLIAPFPSLRVLTLWRIAWEVAPNIENVPPLTDLGLGLRGGTEWAATWSKETREGYEQILKAASGTLRSFSVNLFAIYILTSLHDHKSDDISLGALEELSLELHARRALEFLGKDEKGLPYRQCVADSISFLSRMDAKKTRILNISFDTRHQGLIISDNEFLDSLCNVRKGLEDLVTSKHFPSLQTINVVVVGAGESKVPIWQDHFTACFPLLAEQGLLHVKEHIDTEIPEFKF